jgi:hypothetical protein
MTAVAPAKAGVQGNRSEPQRPWIPAFAGMTVLLAGQKRPHPMMLAVRSSWSVGLS